MTTNPQRIMRDTGGDGVDAQERRDAFSSFSEALLQRRRHLKSRLGEIASVLVFVLASLTNPVASADPQGAHITDVQHVNDRWDKVSVYSPSMNNVVVNDVFKASQSGAPTFYLLPGIYGDGWFDKTDIPGFFANKNVNVVSPTGGPYSWYTDWVNDGGKQYQTYMTRELPSLINAQYHTNGKNAVGGLSSTGGTAIDYAIQAPGVYRAVGCYSGFPSVSESDEAQDVALTLTSGGASADAMWGPPGGPLWVAHDPAKNVAKLKGLGVYAAASSGAAGDIDRLPADSGPNFVGGLIEGKIADSTKRFADAAAAAGVPVTYVVRPEGSHTWGLFESEMQESWNTTIGPALAV